MIRIMAVFILALTVYPHLCYGDAEKDEPCYHEGVVDRKCLQERYEELDGQYKTQYQKILSGLHAEPEDDATDSGILEKRIEWLKQSHSAWLKYRESRCEEAYFQYYPGSLALISRLQCLIEMTAERISETHELYQ